MGLKLFTFQTIAVIFAWQLTFSLASAAETKVDLRVRDDPPTFFLLYSSSGNEKFQVECNPKAKAIEVVTCNFIGTRVNPPSPSNTDNPYDKLSEKEKQELSQATLSKEDKEGIKALEQKLVEPTMGPKTKEFYKSLIAAYKAGNFVEFGKVIRERQARTCQLFVQTFSLEFKKIGRRKWLGNPAPGGLCQIVKIYELTGDETNDLWQMTETRVTAGKTDGICKDVHKEMHKSTVWGWNNPSEYELSCDFITFDTFIPH